jgi:hypothetical protein
MPPLPAVPNVLKADLQWSISGAPLIRTRNYFRYSGGPPAPTDAVALASDIFGAMGAHAILWGPDTGLEAVEVTDLASSGGGQGTHAGSVIGTRAGDLMPSSTCALVNYLISRRYRGGKPRSYWPFFTQNDISTPTSWRGTSTAEVDAALATYFAAVIGASSGTTSITEHVNVGYYEGFTVVTNPITGRAKNVAKLRGTPLVDVISSYATSVRIASQRRRIGR